MRGEVPSGRWNKSEIGVSDQAQDQVIDDCHHMCRCLFREAGLVFMERDIAGIMQSIFDLPVRAEHGQQLLRGSLISCQAGDPVDHLLTGDTRFANGHLPFEFEDLLQERPSQEIIELAAGGDGSDFKPAMAFAGDGGFHALQQGKEPS